MAHVCEATVVGLEPLLFPLQLKRTGLDACRWESLGDDLSRHLFASSPSAFAALIRNGSHDEQCVPELVDGVEWHRGTSIVIPVTRTVRFGEQRVTEHQLMIAPTSDPEMELAIESGGLALMFFPGKHGNQRPSQLVGTLGDVFRPLMLNQRAIREAESDTWEAGVRAYPLLEGGDNTADVSVLSVPSTSRTEVHRHGNRGELTIALGRDGRVDCDGEKLEPGSFDLQGPLTTHRIRVLEEIWTLQVSLDGTELEEV